MSQDEIPNFRKSTTNYTGVLCFIPTLLGMFAGGLIFPIIGLIVSVSFYLVLRKK